MSSSSPPEEESQQLLSEYQSQLNDIELLLAESPDDESLLKLKSDLIELIQLTNEQLVPSTSTSNLESISNIQSEKNEKGEEGHGHENEGILGSNSLCDTSIHTSSVITSASASASASHNSKEGKDIESSSSSTTTTTLKKSKKKILSRPFEIPTHLLPLDSDTDAERKRKKRSIKALKSQYKSTVKEVESEVKQQSWQDFNKKSKKRKGVKGLNGESIFKTEDGVGARTGVITGAVQVMGKERDYNSGVSANGGVKKQRHLF
jgi:survival-of-motor-neuron-related-splicing factor 30